MAKTNRFYISFHGKGLTEKQKDALCKGFAKYIDKKKANCIKVAKND